jgi:hypothetical protein
MTTNDLRGDGPPETTRRRRSRRAGRTLLAGGLAIASATGGVLVAGSASAAVPTFPDNITIFPNRDFISIDGFSSHAGQDVTVQVLRGGTVIGQTVGKFADKAVIDAGNPALEINHPGGICWGVGTGSPNVTPDIVGGDQVVLKFSDNTTSDATSLDTNVTDWALNGSTLVVNGHYGPDVDPTFLEQRIINPDLLNTDVGFRDVRAVPGPLTVNRRNPSFASMLETDAATHTFKATYEFANADTAKVAQAGQMRAMSWQNQDAAANRQGVTIAEFGELGGPGFGGCPPSASTVSPPSPTGVTALENTPGTTTVTWKPATATPGTSPILGYTVRAVSHASTGGGQDEIGKRISNPAATTVDLPTGLDNKTIEVRSLTAAGESWPPALANANLNNTTDVVAPTVSAAPPGGTYATDQKVTLTSNDTQATIFYTLDGSDPLVAADAGTTALKYDPATGVVIPAKDANGNFVNPVTLRYVAFDVAGNPSLAKTETYTFGAAQAPGAPTGVTAKPGNTTADVSWTAPPAGGSAVTGYKITATAAGATAPAASVTALSSATTASLTGLTNGTAYTVSVVATSAAGDGAPGTTTVTPNATETLTAGPVTNKAGDFRVNGTSNAPSGNVSLFKADAAGNPTGAVLATSPLTAATPPATGSTFALRSRTTIASGTKLVITSSNGGKLVITG